ncbi:UPF0058 family protein [Archaeoglobus veneficus]|uniref:Uncharacterized protein n=1 Tax=Archaeoglobus veneficus (strain DSM 11195 / SNP6) TaxID=693661 RepID=F2KN60_ARCVS|nr:UPF0058 family protein [Archaeoglobus veneficus]AEA46161.1 protein of unknown function UPF0058 [Archaeoglobus veneficus SNP6]
MRKKEIIVIHSTLFCIKRLFELAGISKFQAYKELGVFPSHIHKSKLHHKKAIMLICIELLKFLSPQNVEDAQLILEEISTE